MTYQKQFTKEQALQKLKHYCAYQERCHSEAINKLWELGIKKAEHGEIIATLIQENFLNEERFAIQFAGGRFRLKHWGRKKIAYELKKKQVSQYCIKKAISSFDDDTYLQVIEKVAAARYKSLQKVELKFRKNKTLAYMIQKGYEADLVKKVIRNF